MTKRREPLTHQATLSMIAERIGWPRCAAVCGRKSYEAVRLWADPDCPTEIRMIDAERLDRAFMDDGGDHAPFLRLHTLRLDLANRDMPPVCLADLAGSIASQSGEAVAALLRSVSMKNDSNNRDARQRIHEAIDTLTNGLAALDRRERGEQP